MFVLLFLACIMNSLSAGKVSFIDPCTWSDKTCLMASAQKAMPFIAAGIPDLGVPPFDPMTLEQVPLKEGQLEINFKDMIINGLGKCKLVDAGRQEEGSLLVIAAECPIDITSTYTAGGKLIIFPIKASGNFKGHTKNINISAKLKFTTFEGQDGRKHWKLVKQEHAFDPKEKFALNFEDLFNSGNKKADAVNQILNANWKELISTIGKPIVNEVINKIIDVTNTFFAALPIDELQK